MPFIVNTTSNCNVTVGISKHLHIDEGLLLCSPVAVVSYDLAYILNKSDCYITTNAYLY